MKIIDRKITVNLIFLIVLFVVIALLYLFHIYFGDGYTQDKMDSIVSGLITGLIVGVFQLFLSIYEYREIAKFKKMKVLDIKSNRDHREFYANLIMKARSRIDIMGVTANRFVSDFADMKSTREETHILFDAMNRGVEVRILIPDESYLDSDKLRDTAKHAKQHFLEIKQKDNRFNFKYFHHPATHSIFIVDDICILGPVFPGVSSKDTPALQIKKDSPYAEKYLKYFDSEWSAAI